MRSIKVYICIGFGLFTSNVRAQTQAPNGQISTVDYQSWIDASYAHTLLNRKLVLAGDVGFRGLVTQFDWSQFFVRSNVRYSLSQVFKMGAGAAFFKTWDKNSGNTGEFRLFETAIVNWPSWAVIGLKHRFQYEQRLRNTDISSFNFNNAYSSRLRYLLMTETKDFTIFNQKIYGKFGLELFQSKFKDIDLIVDSDRIIAGVGHRVNNHFKYEIHYMIQQSSVDRVNRFETSAHVVRVRLFFRNEKPIKTKGQLE